MTHSVDAPLPPPAASTADVAKDQARSVGQTAAQAGGEVASTAADQAKTVVAETQRQAQDLLDQGRTQLREQAMTQQQKASEGLTSLAQQLRAMADGTSDGTPGPARDLVQQASGKLEEFGSWLQGREPADLLDEIRAYARRKPGTFLLGAALAGVVAGRLTSGIKAAHTGSGSGGRAPQSPNGYDSTNYVDASPSYSSPSYSGPTYAGSGDPYATGTPAATTAGMTGAAGPLPPPPYGTVPPEGTFVPPTTPAGWDDPTRRPGGADR
jgi:hypothetical protein